MGRSWEDAMRDDPQQPANGEPSEHRSGISTLPANQNAAVADVPAPLAIVIRRAGMEYRQCFRESNVAIYLARGPSNRREYETIKIDVLPAGEFNGHQYALRERFPGSTEWGSLGWTFTNNSHRDPLAAALAKARRLIRDGRGSGEQPLSK